MTVQFNEKAAQAEYDEAYRHAYTRCRIKDSIFIGWLLGGALFLVSLLVVPQAAAYIAHRGLRASIASIYVIGLFLSFLIYSGKHNIDAYCWDSARNHSLATSYAHAIDTAPVYAANRYNFTVCYAEGYGGFRHTSSQEASVICDMIRADGPWYSYFHSPVSVQEDQTGQLHEPVIDINNAIVILPVSMNQTEVIAGKQLHWTIVPDSSAIYGG